MAGMGYRTVVLERKPDLGGKVCCTGIVSTECVDRFAIPDAVIHRTAASARIFSPEGHLLHVRRNSPQVAILSRPAFNMAWAERARQKGAEYQFHTETRSITPSPKAATIEAVRHGENTSISARAVVLTCGFGSQLIDRCGLEGVSDFVMGAQAEVESNGIDEVEVYTGSKCAPGFFGWLVPTSPGHALVGLLSRRYPPAYLRTLLARLHAEGRISKVDVPFTYGGVPLRPLPRTNADRLLVVGTAAGQVKPLTGGGIYFGLLCADLAANALNRCLLQDDLSADKLATYQRGWKRRLGREFRTGTWARRVYERLSDQQIDRTFDLLVGTRLIEEIEKSDFLAFDWHADVVSRIFSQRTVVRAFRSVKLPFRLRERLEKDVRDPESARLEKG